MTGPWRSEHQHERFRELRWCFWLREAPSSFLPGRSNAGVRSSLSAVKDSPEHGMPGSSLHLRPGYVNGPPRFQCSTASFSTGWPWFAHDSGVISWKGNLHGRLDRKKLFFPLVAGPSDRAHKDPLPFLSWNPTSAQGLLSLACCHRVPEPTAGWLSIYPFDHRASGSMTGMASAPGTASRIWARARAQMQVMTGGSQSSLLRLTLRACG